MEQVVCKNCGSVDDYRTEKKANNLVAYCNGCGKYIKNIPHADAQAPVLYIGKYKNIPIKEIFDVSYLEWAFKTLKLTSGIRQAVANQIQFLKNEAA